MDLLESLRPRQGTLWERFAFHCTCARYVESSDGPQQFNTLLLLLGSRVFYRAAWGRQMEC